MQTKKVAIIAALCLISMLAGVVVAQILLTHQITNSMRLLGAPEFYLVREDIPYPFPEDLSPWIVESIAWGDFIRGQVKTSVEIVGMRILILNAGNVPIIVGWNATGLNRDDWSISATWATNSPYPENDFNQFRVDCGYTNGFMEFTLSQINPRAVPGDYAFDLNFNAAQAP